MSSINHTTLPIGNYKTNCTTGVISELNLYNTELFCYKFSEVPISEASIVIAISSPHRKESLQAVEYAIDTLKATVPIWKKVLTVLKTSHSK